MKIWKIEHTNKSLENAKIAISLPSNESRGIILKPGEFVLANQQQTASLDSQTRRGYVKVDEFDNSTLNLKLGEAYSVLVLEIKPEPISESLETNEIESEDEGDYLNKLEKAEKDASDYINNETE
jgi:hypothetical protein